MSCKRKAALGLASGLALATALAATPLTPRPTGSLGPAVRDDASLDANLGVLHEIVAWDSSIDAHPYKLAESLPDRGATFNRVALATIPTGHN